MSISDLKYAPYLNIQVNNVVCSELNSIDNTLTNLIVDNLTCSDSVSIQGDLEITNNTNPFINLNPSQNQLLGVGANNQLQFFTIGSQGGGITAITTGTPQDLEISENNNVVNINYSGSTLNYTAGTNINFSGTSNNIINLDSNIANLNSIGSTTIGCETLLTNNLGVVNSQGSTIYSLPVVPPAENNYVLSCNTNGVSQWVAQESGGESYTAGTNINLSGASNNVINLDTNINVNSVVSNNLSSDNITITNSQNSPLYSLPVVLPTNNNNQVLSCTNTGVCSWIPQTGGGSGITEVNGTVNQIVSQEANNIVTLSLPEQISLSGNEPQIQLQNTLATNTLILTDDSINLNNANNNIRITPSSVSIYDVSTNTTINELNASGAYVSSVNLVDSSFNTVYSLPSTIGLEAQVLSCNPTTKVCYWATAGSGGSGVQSVTANPNTPNIIVNNTSPENPVISFTNNPSFVNIDIHNVQGDKIYGLTPELGPTSADSILMFDIGGNPDFVPFPYVQASNNISVQNNTVLLNDTIVLVNSESPSNVKCTLDLDSIGFSNSNNNGVAMLSSSIGLITKAINVCDTNGNIVMTYPNTVGNNGDVLTTQNGALVWNNPQVVTDFENLNVSNEITAGTTIDGKNQIQMGFINAFDDNALFQSNDVTSSYLSSNILIVPQIVVQQNNTSNPVYTFPMNQPITGQTLVASDNNGSLAWSNGSSQTNFTTFTDVVLNFNSGSPMFPVYQIISIDENNGNYIITPSQQNMRATVKLTNSGGVTQCKFSFFDPNANYNQLCSTLGLPSSSDSGPTLSCNFINIPLEFLPSGYDAIFNANETVKIVAEAPFLYNSAQFSSTGNTFNDIFVLSSTRLPDFTSYGMPALLTFSKSIDGLSMTLKVDFCYPCLVKSLTGNFSINNNTNTLNGFGGGSQQFFTIYHPSDLVNPDPGIYDKPVNFSW